MFSKTRKHFNYANIALTVALVFAMSGGAYAASKYLITSTKQISPKVLKALAGKTGRAGATGPAGPQGPQGPEGKPGATGKEGTPGKNGENGKEGTPGKNGENGKEGSPWTPNNTLPEGATEKGTWANVHTAATANEASGSPISFTVPLARVLPEGHVHYFGINEKGKGGGCPATSEASKPEAEAGNLCVFASAEENAKPAASSTSLTILNPEIPGLGEAGKTGAIVFSASLAAGEMRAYGTWAVTAP